MWSSAPASKSCLYGSSFVWRGIIGPLKEVKCRLLVCLLGQDGPRASAERVRLFSPPSSILWPHICIRHSKSRPESNVQGKHKTMHSKGFQWWQFAVQKADTPIHINPPINSESVQMGLQYKGCFFQVFFITGLVPQLGLDPPGDSWEVTKLCKKSVNRILITIFTFFKITCGPICNTLWHKASSAHTQKTDVGDSLCSVGKTQMS